MGIMLLLVYRSQGTVVLPWEGGGGGSSPQVKNPLGDHLKFKSRCHFQYDTTKSLSISKAIHKNKIINLNSKLLFCSHFAF